MEDTSIIELFQSRSEGAINALAEKYGGYCRAAAGTAATTEIPVTENEEALPQSDAYPTEAADITLILITPTYVDTYFTMYGKKMCLSCFYNEEEGKNAYSYGVYKYENEPEKAVKLDIYGWEGENNGVLLYTVYGYEANLFGDPEFCYVWQQDGKYFELEVRDSNYIAEFAAVSAKYIPI